MVYLAAIRHSQDSVSKLRRVTPGTRVPIDSTAVGLAYLAALPPPALESVLAKISTCVHGAHRRKDLEKNLTQVRKRGFSIAAFMPGNEAVGRTFVGPDHQLYAMNISFVPREGRLAHDRRHYALILKGLIESSRKAWMA